MTALFHVKRRRDVFHVKRAARRGRQIFHAGLFHVKPGGPDGSSTRNTLGREAPGAGRGTTVHLDWAPGRDGRVRDGGG